MTVTKCSIKKGDNEQVLNWSRQATVDEGKAVFSSDIIHRLVTEHQRKHGNEPPKITGDSEQQI